MDENIRLAIVTTVLLPIIIMVIIIRKLYGKEGY